MYQYLSAEYCPFQLSFHDNIWTVTNGLYYAAGFILILQGGKGREKTEGQLPTNLLKDRRVPGQKAVVWAFGDIKALTLQGNALEPCICRSRYRNVKKSYKNQRIFGESEKERIFAVFKKNKSINRSVWNNKKYKL